MSSPFFFVQRLVMVNTLEPNKRWVLYILCLAQFTLSADVANLSISTATLVNAFDSDIATIQLLGSVQPLIGAALMLSASMLGLIVGWRRLLISGAALGFISSLGFLFFDSILTISLIARPLSGISSAMILPAALALIVAHFPGKERALGFGMMAAATGLAAAITPLLSGWIQDNLHWQWTFVFITALYLLTLLGSIRLIKPIHTNRPAKFDALGALLGALSIITLFLGLLKAPYWGVVWAPSGANIPNQFDFLRPLSPVLVLLGVGSLLLSAFIYQQLCFEKRHGYALLPVSWFIDCNSRTGFIILSLMYVSLGGSSFIIITYLQVAIGLASIHSGAIILLFSTAMIISSILTPLIFKRASPKILCCNAFIGIALAGLMLMLSSSKVGITTSFYLGMILLGIAMGVLACQCPVIITNTLPERQAEQSGGLQAMVRNISLVIGISLFAGVNQTTLDQFVRSNIETNSFTPSNLVNAIHQRPHIPYVNDDAIKEITVNYEMNKIQSTYLIKLNAWARAKGFDFVMLTLISIALFGLLVSSQIKTRSLEPLFSRV